MAYTQVGIVNLALLRIGANVAASMAATAPNVIKANAVWDYILDEVLQAKDWRFAKIRHSLTVSTQSPEYAYLYAYELPSDFLRLVRRKKSSAGRNPAPYPTGGYGWTFDNAGSATFLANYDPPVYPDFPYIIEMVDVVVLAPPSTTPTLCLLTDYDNTDNDLYINYIRRVTDVTKFTPAFINALAFRLAWELAIPITEDENKAVLMQQAYRQSLTSAEAFNESLDYLPDETGSTAWEDAGR